MYRFSHVSSQPHKPVIGLIGGIGAGKSMVARQLEQLGCAVIDADKLARQALGLEDVRDRLTRWWGPSILAADGQVDRPALAKILFGDREQLRRLEQLTHAHVHRHRQRLRLQYQRDLSIKAIVEDCPLLMEVGLDKDCDAVILIEAGRPQRLARLARSRGWSERDLAHREKFQLTLDKKAERADYTIVNDADESECLTQVHGVFFRILCA